MYKVSEHKRLATGGYKGPQGTGRDIKGDSWKDPKKKSSKKRKKSKNDADIDDVQKVKKGKRKGSKRKGKMCK